MNMVCLVHLCIQLRLTWGENVFLEQAEYVLTFSTIINIFIIIFILKSYSLSFFCFIYIIFIFIQSMRLLYQTILTDI